MHVVLSAARLHPLPAAACLCPRLYMPVPHCWQYPANAAAAELSGVAMDMSSTSAFISACLRYLVNVWRVPHSCARFAELPGTRCSAAECATWCGPLVAASAAVLADPLNRTECSHAWWCLLPVHSAATHRAQTGVIGWQRFARKGYELLEGVHVGTPARTTPDT